MKAQATLIVVVFGIAPVLCSQQPAIEAMNLKTSARVEVPLSSRASLFGQATCDGIGNVYVRQLDVETARNPSGPTRLPIMEVSPAGKVMRTFRITDALGHDVSGMEFFVDQGGRVYQAAIMGNEAYVVQFAEDGSVIARKKLETGSRHFTSLSHLAVFRSGEYLLIGDSGNTGHVPFTAVFASDGRLVKEIYEPEDEEARKQAEIGDTQYVSGAGGVGNRFVSMGDVAMGPDNNAYLLHGTSPTLIYAISSAGAVVHKLRVPVDDPDFKPASVKAYGDRLAIEFVQSSDAGIATRIIDLTGKPIAEYRMEAVGSYSLALACYNSEGLTFVPYFAESKLYLLKAKLP